MLAAIATVGCTKENYTILEQPDGSDMITKQNAANESVKLVWTETDNELITGNTISNTLLYFSDETDGPTNVSEQATWKTSDPTIATVDDGKITALSAGTATITAEYKDMTASCTIRVLDAIVVGNISVKEITYDGITLVKVDATCNNGTELKNLGYTWECISTSDEGVMSLHSTGKTPIRYSNEGTDNNYTFLLHLHLPENVMPQNGSRYGDVTTGITVKATSF